MTIEEYAQEIATQISGTYTEVVKNNNIVLHGVSKHTMVDVCPQVYVDNYYNDGLTVDEAIEKVNDIIDNATVPDFDIATFTDWNQAKKHLYVKAVNAINDPNYEITFSIPFRGYEDIILVPYVGIYLEDGVSGAIVVKKEHLKLWNKDEETIQSIAYVNTREEFKLSKFGEILPIPQTEEVDMYIASNKNIHYGAASALLSLPDIHAQIGRPFFIIPSSVDEVIILPYTNEDDIESLNFMIEEVNEEYIECEKVLSNHVYTYGV